MLGNGLIAIGALLPGIGGTFTRFGHVEVLYGPSPLVRSETEAPEPA